MMTKDDSSEVLGDRELDAVSGGFIRLILAALKVLATSNYPQGTGGATNDSVAMFQQMQDLTGR
jgi:hypothetical protein